MLCGARITLSYMRPGGVLQDAPEEFWPALDTLIGEMPRYIDELEGLITTNEIVLARTRGIGVVPPDLAVAGSLTGPMLRASGVQWDLRKADPYEIYDRVEFDVPIGYEGDTYDRYYVRIQEMRQSVRIIEQCIEQIEKGPRAYRWAFLRQAACGRRLRGGRGPEGRAWILPRERWRDIALSV